MPQGFLQSHPLPQPAFSSPFQLLLLTDLNCPVFLTSIVSSCSGPPRLSTLQQTYHLAILTQEELWVMSYNGDKLLAHGLHFPFPSPVWCDCCNLVVTTQTSVWFLSNTLPFCEAWCRNTSEHPFPPWPLPWGGSEVWVQPSPWWAGSRTSPWVAHKQPRGLDRFLGAGSPCLDALIWRPEKMTAAMQAKCFSVVCKAALKNLKDYKDQPTCTF